MNHQQDLIKVIEELSAMMSEFEDKALNSDELADLTLNQIHYLDIINKLEEPTFSALADMMEVSKPTVTMAVNKLIRQGYVQKVQSTEDRRVYHVLLTQKGEQVVTVHDRAHRDFASLLTHCLSEKELENLVKIFKKVIDCK